MNYDVLISFIIATAALAIAPGPDNIYVLLQSITHGKRSGLATVAGLISGCLVHTTFVAFGVSAVIKNNPHLFLAIKILGAVYLFFLAYKVYQSDSQLYLDTTHVPQKKWHQLFKQGVMMNVINPKVSLFFLALFPGFLFSDTLSHVTQFYILGLLFITVSFFVFSAIAILSGMISDYVKKHTNIGKYLKWFQVVTFVLIAMMILI